MKVKIKLLVAVDEGTYTEVHAETIYANPPLSNTCFTRVESAELLHLHSHALMLCQQYDADAYAIEATP